jgi:hypothetical protein
MTSKQEPEKADVSQLGSAHAEILLKATPRNLARSGETGPASPSHVRFYSRWLTSRP